MRINTNTHMEHAPRLQDLKGLGAKVEENLKKLNIHNFEDLIFHFPFRYEDRTRVTPIARLRLKQLSVVDAEVVNAKILFGKRRSLSVAIRDSSGVCFIRLFHFSQSQSKQFIEGAHIRVIGEPRLGSQGLEFYHPEYRLFKNEAPPLEQNLSPVYHSCEGISSTRLSQLIKQALQLLQKNPQQSLFHSLDLKNFEKQPDLNFETIIKTLHQPGNWDEASLLSEGRHPYQKLLALEELVAHSLSAKNRKANTPENQSPPIQINAELYEHFKKNLPFQLTRAQQKVISEINNDLQQGKTMRRLVQGDVGSGKTLVAASTALQVIQNGFQVALMVPTEILAEQHMQNFSRWFANFNIEVCSLLGKHNGKKRKEILESMASGKAKMIIGTHALFQKDVLFHKLGFVIIDEQHRFGVHQRLALSQKSKELNSGLETQNATMNTTELTSHQLIPQQLIPHQLIMTATPIPRSLAMTIYGDLDCSVIDEMPPGRMPVKTVLIDNKRRHEVIERIRIACGKKTQAYWVCTLIEESESLQAKAAEDLLLELQQSLPNIKIALIHGRLKTDEKSNVINDFRESKIDLLVATTVIEVGVDIPNASVMVIENPERLGLAQLHQLRGRVGRGATESFCVLLYEAPLGAIAQKRLTTMRDSNDGFVIAEQDLMIRGPGEVLGTRQAGAALFKVADLLRDSELLETAQEIAQEILQKYPQHAQKFMDRWLGEKQNLGEVG